jgi:hypothetical protein
VIFILSWYLPTYLNFLIIFQWLSWRRVSFRVNSVNAKWLILMSPESTPSKTLRQLSGRTRKKQNFVYFGVFDKVFKNVVLTPRRPSVDTESHTPLIGVSHCIDSVDMGSHSVDSSWGGVALGVTQRAQDEISQLGRKIFEFIREVMKKITVTCSNVPKIFCTRGSMNFLFTLVAVK